MSNTTILILGATLIVGVLLWKLGRTETNSQLQNNYLETLRRELANLIIEHDLETFEKTFNRMLNWEAELVRSDHNRKHAEYNALLHKFPALEDFDVIGTRHFICYELESLGGIGDLVERYAEISKYLALDRIRQKSISKLYSKNEVQVFRETMHQYKDRRLRNAIEEAMQRYYIWRNGRGEDKPYDVYDDKDYEVTSFLTHRRREFTPEIQYGIVCKKLKENGVYSFFVADGDKTYYSYYRSNESFTEDERLQR